MGLQRAFREFFSTFSREMSQLHSRSFPGGAPAAFIILAFRDAGAVSRRTAQRYHPRTRHDERAFALLLDSDIIRQPVPGRFYLDEEVLGSYAPNPFR